MEKQKKDILFAWNSEKQLRFNNNQQYLKRIEDRKHNDFAAKLQLQDNIYMKTKGRNQGLQKKYANSALDIKGSYGQDGLQTGSDTRKGDEYSTYDDTYDSKQSVYVYTPPP